MSDTGATTRLEAFSDGVFAIALTLLVIDLRLPDGTIASTADFWHVLASLGPTFFAFILSFAVVLITWVNHHAALRFVRRASPALFYANGFLLLTVVFIPFPTSLLGRFVWTPLAAPAVVLYDAVLTAQALAWILLTGAAIGDELAEGHSLALLRDNRRSGFMALGLYGALAVLAFWLPVTVAVITTISWLFWLVLSVRLREPGRRASK